ncbi:MAG: antibiotic biosynthesis monooxygenase [Deltaproteobacteria bacterium]|nr:MAG: antibiotic biosynthesis monooxygenase [Deltaproteobacteria bacterium]
MLIVRLIYVTVNPDQASEAERIWKNECAPLMIRQPGCLSEKLLKCVDAPGEYISYSEWESQEKIDAYRVSDAHKKIKEHTRTLRGGERPVVKQYQVGS